MIIIGIAGRKRSGKGSIATALVSKYGFKRYAYAGKLKELVKALYPWIPDEVMYGEDREHVTFLSPPDMVALGAPPRMTCRQIQQAVGQAQRRVFGEDSWVNVLVEQINHEAPRACVIEDIRQPNEMATIHRSGGYIIRTNRLPRIHFHHYEPGENGDCDYTFTFGRDGPDQRCGRAPEVHPISWTSDQHSTEWALPEESIIYDRVVNATTSEDAVAQALAFVKMVIPS